MTKEEIRNKLDRALLANTVGFSKVQVEFEHYICPGLTPTGGPVLDKLNQLGKILIDWRNSRYESTQEVVDMLDKIING